MPASRWNTSVNEMLEWLREEERIDELLFTPIVTHNQDGEGSQSESGNPGEGAESQIPSILPILPLRGLVVYPQTAVPLTIGQPRSIRLVDDVMSGDDRLIGLVSARNPELETPEPARPVQHRHSGDRPSPVPRSGWHHSPGCAGDGALPPGRFHPRTNPI